MQAVIPGPRGLDLLKTSLSFQRDPLTTLTGLTGRYGDVVTYRYGPFKVVLLNHPEAVQRVLLDNHTNYGKAGNPFYRMLRWFLGNGLLTSDGAHWRRQRRLAQPSFQRKRLDEMSPMMVACASERVDRWVGKAQLDVSHEMMELALRIFGLALFSQDLSGDSSDIGRSLDVMQIQMTERFQSWVPLPPVLPTARDRRFRDARNRLSRLVLHQVRERRRVEERPADLLTTLLEARDPETGETMSDEQIRDELVTFLLAGHETTANTMSWTFALLSRHPDVRRRLEAELAGHLGGRLPTCDDLPHLPFTERVILEALRLYPPAWVFGRCAIGPDSIRGFPIPAGQVITIAPYVLHRHPEMWNNPEGFDPDRFAQERPKCAFVPFAAGPRQCIGNYFSMLEARLILATIAQRVRLNLVPGARILPDPLVTLRPRYGVPVTPEFR